MHNTYGKRHGWPAIFSASCINLHHASGSPGLARVGMGSHAGDAAEPQFKPLLTPSDHTEISPVDPPSQQDMVRRKIELSQDYS
jgi:hypothetical protein